MVVESVVMTFCMELCVGLVSSLRWRCQGSAGVDVETKGDGNRTDLVMIVALFALTCAPVCISYQPIACVIFWICSG